MMRMALTFGIGLGSVSLGLVSTAQRHANCTRAMDLDALKRRCDDLAAQIIEAELVAQGRQAKLERGEELAPLPAGDLEHSGALDTEQWADVIRPVADDAEPSVATPRTSKREARP